MNRLDEFDVVIRRRENKVIAAVPQLSLYAMAADVNSALAGLDRKKAALLEELTEVGGLQDQAMFPAAAPIPATPAEGLQQFMTKAGVIAACIAIAAVVAAHFITLEIDRFILTKVRPALQFERISGRDLWERIETNLDKLADPQSDLPAEKKAKILANIRVVRDRWWPFVEAAIPAPGDARSLDREPAKLSK